MGIQSITRMTRVLDAVAASGEVGAKLADVVAATDLTRATTYRFLKALAQEGLLDFDGALGRYFVGIKLAALAQSALNKFGLAARAAPRLTELCKLTGDTVYFTVRVGDEALCVARHEGDFPIKTLTLKVGDLRPLGVGAGSLALLAFLPEDERERLLALQSGDFAEFGLSEDVVRGMVLRSRELGYAINDGRIIPGMSAVAVPVSDDSGFALAAISVAAITDRMNTQRRAGIVEALRREAALLEGELAPLLRILSQSRSGAPSGGGTLRKPRRPED